MNFIHVLEGLKILIKRIDPVDDRGDLAGFTELLQNNQVLIALGYQQRFFLCILDAISVDFDGFWIMRAKCLCFEFFSLDKL